MITVLVYRLAPTELAISITASAPGASSVPVLRTRVAVARPATFRTACAAAAELLQQLAAGGRDDGDDQAVEDRLHATG